MMIKAAAIAVSLAAMALASGRMAAGQGTPPAGKPCLHDANETAEQKSRRTEGLTATRNINNIQAGTWETVIQEMRDQRAAAEGHPSRVTEDLEG